MPNQKITYEVGFVVDNQDLSQLKQQLIALEKDFGLTDIQLINKQDTNAALQDLNEIKNAARVTGEALEASFNPKINSLNIQTFQNYLQQSNLSVHDLSTAFAKAGQQGEQAFRNIAIQVMNTGFQLKETNSLIKSMGTTLVNTIKWSVASSAINTITGSIQQAWGYTQKLDSSLNDIRIVTDKSADSMEKFAKQANKAAKSLGAATTDYTNASLIYYQQGLGDEDVQARTEATVKAANVTGQSAAEVSEQLTAVWNGYKVVAEDAELYVDKLAAVAATTAADLEELSEGMSKVASSANAMGVDIDQLSAQLSTIVSVTRQDANVVGTALKTIYARMGDLQVDGVDEFGTSLGDVSGKMRQMGIEVLDQEGNLRDMGEVIEEVAAKWGTWTDAQQQAAAVAIAGKRQYNNLIALFENWDMYESALTTSQTSAGTLQKQQNTYMESLEAHLTQLSTAGEKVYDAFFDSDSMKDLIDALTVIVDTFGSFVNSIGGGGNLLLGLGSIAVKVFKQDIAQSIVSFINNLQAAKFNASQLEAELALLSQFGKEIDLHSDAYRQLVEMKKEELKYQQYLTAEQRQQANALIEQKNTLETVKEEQAERAKILEKEYNILTGESAVIVGGGAEHILTSDTAKTLDTQQQKVNAAQFKKEQSTTAIENFEKSYGSIDDLTTKRNSLRGKMGAQKRQLNKTGNLVADEETWSEDNDQLFEEQNKKLIQLQEEYNNVSEAIKIYNQLIKEEAQAQEELNTETSKKEELEKEKNVTAVSVDEASKTFEDAAKESRDMSFNVSTAISESENNLSPDNQLSDEEYAAAMNNRIKAVTELQTAVTSNNKVLTEENNIKLQTLQTDEKYRVILDKVTKGIKLEKNEQERLQEYLKKANAILNNNTEHWEDNSKAINDNATAAKGTQAQVNQLSSTWKGFVKNLNTTAIVSGVNEIIGSVGQLASAWQSLKNIGNIISDDSLSSGEKMVQVISAISMAYGMLKGTVSGVTNGLKEMASGFATNTTLMEINKELSEKKTEQDKLAYLQEKAKTLGVDENSISENKNSVQKLLSLIAEKTKTTATNEGTKATWLQTAANWAMQASMWQITLVIFVIVAAIVLLVSLITALTKAFQANGDNGKEAFKKTSEAANAATEEFNKVKEAYDELKKSLEDYNKAQEAIEELTVGTDEWRQAIQEANMQVIDLMNKYPELAKYVDNINGQLKISAAGQEAVLNAEIEKVNTASRANMAAQVNKLNAQNNMTKLEGSNKALNTDSYQNAGLANIIVGAVLGNPTLALSSIALNAEANNREAAYAEALNMIAEDNSIMSSEEAFANAMAEAGFSEYIDALWEQRDALLENSAMLEANNAAIKIQQEEIARSYLAETKEFENLESEDQNTLAKIVAQETGTNSEAYKEAIEKLGGEDVSDKEAKEFADQYADLMGIDAVETKVENGVITYTDSNGKDTEVNTKNAQTALAQEIAGANVTDEYVQKKIDQINAVKEAAANGMDSMVKSSGELLAKFVAGETADLTSGVGTQIQELQNAVSAYETAFNNEEIEKDKFGNQTNLEEQMAAGGNAFANALGYENEEKLEAAVKEMGYKDIEEYKDAIQESIDNYKKEEAKLTLGLDTDVSGAFNTLKSSGKLDNVSLEIQKVIVKGMETAFTQGGQSGLDAFNKMISEGGFTANEIQKISDAMSGIDWSSSGAVNDLSIALENAGIEINKNSDYWKELVASIEASTNVVQDVINNLDTLRGTLASIAEITDSLHLGDIISDEDYNTLVANNAELKKYFVMTADGYKYLGGAEKEIEKAKNNILDVDEIKQNFAEAEAAGESLVNAGSAFLLKDEQTGKIKIKAGKQKDFSEALQSGKYNALLDASGYSSERYQNAAKELSEGTSNYLAGAKISDINKATDVTDLAKRLGYIDEKGNGSVKAFAEANDLSFDEAQELLKNALDDANGRVADAEEYMKNAETAAMNSINAIESGEWDELSREAQTATVSGLAKNYDELKALAQEYKDKYGDDKEILNKEDYNKLALTYLAEEAEQLGINASAWEAYVKSMEKNGKSTEENLDAQDNMLKIFQELDLYEQADAYYYLNKAIEQVTAEIDKLADAQERLYGIDVLDNIDAQIKKYEELYEEQQKLFDKQKNQEELAQVGLNFNNAALNELGIENIVYNKDGTVAETSYEAIYTAALQTRENGNQETYNLLVEILNSITDYNNSIFDRIQSEQDALSEKNNNILDAQIEAYNQEIEMNREFRKTVKEWNNTIRDFKRFTVEGIAAFEELSASQSLTNIMDELNELGMGANNPESFNEISQLESWKNGGGVDNPFVEDGIFNAKAFNEAYTSAMENAQEDVQELIDLGQELFDTWFTALEEISALYDEQVEKLSTINSLLESSANLNKLFGKSSAQYYTQIRQNAEKTVELYGGKIARDIEGNIIKDETGNLKYETEGLVQQLEKQFNAIQKDSDGFFREILNEEGEIEKERMSPEQVDAIWDDYAQAKQNYVDAIQAQYDAITAEFEASMQEIVDGLFNQLGGSLNNFSELWNLQKSADDMYFDDVNAEYEKYKFERAVQSSIDTTDNIAAQNKLKNVLNEQLAILEKKDKLSQYDIDRANAMYELTLKQIALEEAQQTANKMKLTRDAMGNYTYQYVADEDQIAKAEEELAAAENNLYNLQKDHQSELIDTLISGVQEYQELSVKYMNDPTMLEEINNHYSTFFDNLKGDMEELGMDISGLTDMFETDMSTPWMDTFNSLAQIDTAGLLESTAKLFNGENGEGGIIAALQSVQDNFDDYLIAEGDANARLTSYVSNTTDLNTKATELADKMTTATSTMNTLVTNISTLVGNLETYANKYTEYLNEATNPGSTGNNNNSEEDIAAAVAETNTTTTEMKDAIEEGNKTAESTNMATRAIYSVLTIAPWLNNNTNNINNIDWFTEIPDPGDPSNWSDYFSQLAGTGVTTWNSR